MSLINFSFILHVHVFDFTTSILCKFIDMSYGSWTIYCHAIPSECLILILYAIIPSTY